MKKTLLRHVLYIGAFVLYALFIGCPMNRLFGLRCPFCGMTSAHLSFLRGDFSGALAHHPLFFLGLPIVWGGVHLRVLRRYRTAFAADVIFLTLAAAALTVRYVYSIAIS